MRHLRHGIERFQQEVSPGLQERFQSLVDGQSPHTLFITCSDSRIDPSLITQTLPGELFVVRNAGNLVPPPGEDDGSGSAVAYAVAALKVGHVVVCGHSGCGAMGGLLDPDSLAALPSVARWVQHARPTLDAVADVPSGERLAAAVRDNVLRQVENLRQHPSVAAALEEGRLDLHGWVYHIGSGHVEEVTSSTDAVA